MASPSSQSSSMPFLAISSAPGFTSALSYSQSVRCVKPSPSTSTKSSSPQSWSTPSYGTSVATGWVVAAVSSQSSPVSHALRSTYPSPSASKSSSTSSSQSLSSSSQVSASPGF